MEVQVKAFLQQKKGYLKKSSEIILERLGYSDPTEEQKDLVLKIKREVNEENLTKYLRYDENNVLVIGDLHEPFCLPKYLDRQTVLLRY